MKTRVLVSTCNKYLWALRPFAHQFNKYWSTEQEVIVGGYAPPTKYGIELPSNFAFHQIQPKEFAREKRSDGLIRFFKQMPDEIFVWMLEDFWLIKRVDTNAINLLTKYMHDNPNILRIDLSRDRTREGIDYGKLGHIDLIQSLPRMSYHWSHQGALWRKSLMLKYMRDGEGGSRAPIEIWCGRRLVDDENGPLVLGTKNWPLSYAHTIWKGNPDKGHIRLNHRPPVPAADIHELRELGYI